jgi:hypothetical protein
MTVFLIKLSVHASGQVHVVMGRKVAGPLIVPPLFTLNGEHVAAVVPDAFEALPILDGSPRTQAAEVDHVIPAEGTVENGRLAIYVNGSMPEFGAARCRLTIELRRRKLLRPVYIGVKPVGQSLLGEGTHEGITVVTGWDPTAAPGAALNYPYIRGL